MRQQVAKLWPVVFVGGCSLVYNENNIDGPSDARPIDAPDAAIDANAADLMVTGVESPALIEGQGDDGSRPAVLVVRGTNIVAGATVAVTAESGTALVEVVDEPAVISSQNDLIAVRVIARVDTTLAANATTSLVVKVSQPSPLGGNVEKMTTWQLRGLDELVGATGTVNTAMAREYSRVAVTTLGISGSGKVIVRATASIAVTNAINVSAVTGTNSATPGPGGFAGGAGGSNEADGMGPGFGKQGVSGSKGGGGAGFSVAGGDGGSNIGSGGQAAGDQLITRYATNAGSGGGGAQGFGGAGGGTLELTAGGNLMIGALVSANGSVGKDVALLGAGGGGGSGGVVVLRSGATAMVTGISVAGGAGGSSGLGLSGVGGPGRAGRARIDAVAISGDSGPAHRGVMFATEAPAIVRTTTPVLTLLGSSGDSFDLQRVTTNFAPLGAKTTVDFGGATTLDDVVTPALDAGFNRVCVVPKDSGLGNPESRNCIDLVYVP